ncbi:MAG TPA: PDZ domain-containing protein [Gemmatimonadaceae bacterium]
MRTTMFIPMTLAAAMAAAPATAQVVVRTAPRAYAYSFNTTSPRAVIGVTMATGDAQDTLGIRISEVAAGSPAEKAGIKEGDRLQSINGINLKLSAIDIGDQEMADAMSRRLTRELGKLKPGDDVSLVVDHDGQAKTVRVKTVESDDLYGSAMGFMRRTDDNRAALGVSLSVTGSKRDTLGVLIVGVNDDGPAAKAGLEEGNRIAAINGVNLKVDREDAGDRYVSSARYERLQREMRKVKPGDDVTLEVYADGRFKTVHLKAAKSSELAGNGGTFIFRGNEGQMMPAVDFNYIGPEVRENVQRAMDEVRRSMQDIRLSPRVRWMDDNSAPDVIRMDEAPPAPPALPAPPLPALAPRPPASVVIRAAALAPVAAPARVDIAPTLRTIRF